MEYIGKSVKVYWKEDNEWFSGIIEDYNERKGYHIQYYDGDDEWLNNLNDVQFIKNEDEEDYEGDEGEEEHNNYNNYNSYNNTNDIEKDLDNTYNNTYNNTNNAYNNHHDNDNDSDIDLIDEQSQYSNIELNDNGILLKGQVTGANNLSFKNDQDYNNIENNNNEGIFYRILYVEGSSNNSMFRCKTPIYKSNNSNNIEFPRWNEEPFRFEMVLPGDLPSLDFTQLGDIIIALYKSRKNGGSDFIAQVSISIQDFLRIGTVSRGRPGNECRILNGSYVLVDKRGQMLGGGADIDINLRLEWKTKIIPQKTTLQQTLQKEQQRSQKLNSNGSVSGTSKRSSSTTRPRSSNSTNHGNNGNNNTTNNKRSTSAGRNTSINYRRDRQQSVIEKENEAMRLRLEKAGPKKIGNIDRVGVIRDIYKPQSNEISSKQLDAKKRHDLNIRSTSNTPTTTPRGNNNNNNNNEEEESKESIPLSLNLSKKSQSELTKLYNDLKLQLVNEQKILLNNKTQLNKLTIQIEKQQSLVERMKKVELQSRKSVKTNTNDNSNSNNNNNNSNEINMYSVEEILKRNGLSENEEEISDQVLRELVIEHSALQQTRVTLLERKRNYEQQTETINKEANQLKLEVDNISNILRESVNKTQKSNWNLHQLKRLNRLQQAKQEYESVKEKKKLECICGSVHDNISNSIEQIKILDKLIESKNTNLDKILYDAENWKVKLDDLQQENLVGKMRNSINLMRNSLFRLQRQERLAGIKSEADAIELEVLRHNLNYQILLTK